MKAGTTSLYDLLASSDEFNLPQLKEPHILKPGRGVAALRRDYAAHFGRASGLRGDGSTNYAMLPVLGDVSALAAEVAGPALKVVMIVRDPIARITSHLRHDWLVGRLAHDRFDEIVLAEPRYVAFSDYPYQLRPWIAAVGRENLLVVRFEEMVRDPVAVARTVCAFLGADPARIVPGAQPSNQASDLRVQLKPGPLARFLRSRFYRQVIRTRLPRAFHRAARDRLMERRAVAEVTLSPEVRRRLEERFAGQEAELAALLAR